MLTNNYDLSIRGLLAGAALTVLIGTVPTVASGAPMPAADLAAADSGAAAPDTPGLGEIVVTARRREESLQKVPIAVTVLSTADIARQNIVSPNDLNSVVPSLSVNNQSVSRDSAKFSMRGLGQVNNGDPSVVTYFGEVPTNATGPGYLFDLQNIQILKGPQGTLFGRSTTGGAVLLQPTKPGNDFGGYVDVNVGDYNLKRVQAAVDFPIVSNKVLLRLATDVNQRDGFTRDAFTGALYDGRNYKAFRLSLILRPFEGFENYTVLDKSDADNTESGTVLTAFTPNGLVYNGFPAAGIPAYPGVAAVYAAQQARGVRVTDLEVPPNGNYQRIVNRGITNITTYDLNDSLTLKNIFGDRLFAYHVTYNVSGTPYPIISEIPANFNGAGGASDPSSRTISDEAQIQGKAFDGRLTYIGGLYYERVKPEALDNADLIVQFAAPITLKSLKFDTSRAVFGQVTYELIPGLKLTGGARYTKDDRSESASDYIGSSSATGICTFNPPQPPGCIATASAQFHATTWNTSLDYQLTRSTLVYATVRRGYKSGGFNTSSPDPTHRAYQPEFITDVELGVKNEFDLGGVPGRISFDVYRSDFKQLQELGAFVGANGATLTGIVNAGHGVIEGAEVEGLIKPAPWFTVSAMYSYVDPRYLDNEIPGTGNLIHQPFYNTPRNKFSVTPEFQQSLGKDIGTFDISATYSYQSKVYFAEPLLVTFGNANRGQAGYGLLNLRAGLNDVGGSPLDAYLFMTNATNRAYKTFEFDAYDSLGYAAAIYGEPRMWGAGVRYRFGGGGNH
jgi:iron complex outermembrane receptor protein